MSIRNCTWALTAAVAALAGCLPVELSVSPTGQVLIPRQEGYFIYDSAAGTVGPLYAPKGKQAVFAQYSPDGKQALLVASSAGGGMSQQFAVAVMDVAGGQPRQVYTGENITYAKWSPDAKAVAVTQVAARAVAPLEQNLPELIVVNAADGAKKKLLSNCGMIFRWLPDGRILAIQITAKEDDVYTGALVSVDTATGQAMAVATVLGPQEMFLDVSPAGDKALLTAYQAAKPGQPLATKGDRQGDESGLFEVTLADGAVRAVRDAARYAVYSPKGTKVLLAVKGEGDNGLKLEVADAALAKAVTVADDAAGSSDSGPEGADIYAGWLDDNTVLYLTRAAVYGTACKNFQLTSVDAEGKTRTNHQPAIEAGIKRP